MPVRALLRTLRHHRPRGPLWTGLLISVFCGVLPACAATRVSTPVGSPEGPPATTVLTDTGELYFEAIPERGEGLLRFAARLTGSPQNAADIAAANGGIAELEAGFAYKVPFALLLPDHQVAALRALFPRDRGVEAGWEHVVTRPPGEGGETLWQVAEWFTGDGRNYKVIRAQNELVDEEIIVGQRLLVPVAILRPALRATLPPASGNPLSFRDGPDGSVAIYHLQGGEALYSSVVVRFTGRVFAADVSELAHQLAEASGIADVTDIPIGYPIRIPVEHLLPEFLPEGNPRRVQYEETLAEAQRFTNTARASTLEGITVILDAGHGGRDSGAVSGEVWESVYVYDVVLRTQRLLRTITAASVLTTTRDGAEERIPAVDVLQPSRGHQVLTDPPYPIENAAVGVNLRWYLANSRNRAAHAAGAAPDQVIFLSVHADSLHPSLRGGMVYVPGASGRSSSYSRSGPEYGARREVRERPTVRFDSRSAARSEGLSRQLAEKLLDGYRRLGLEVHAYQPIRDRIVRSRNWSYVPAVLRYNEVPAAVLLEICNLNNPEDRALLRTQKYRQQVAEAIVHGILDYYGAEVSPALVAAGSVAAAQP